MFTVAVAFSVVQTASLDKRMGWGKEKKRERNIPGISPVHHFSLVHSFNLDVLSRVIRAESLQNCQRLKFTTDIRTPQNTISNTSHASVRMHYNADISLGLKGKL